MELPSGYFSYDFKRMIAKKQNKQKTEQPNKDHKYVTKINT
jgi:hypothetical protein